MKKLSSLNRPFVILVVSEPTETKVIKLIDQYEMKVDAFEINLTVLQEDTFQNIFSSTSRPCLATNRRASFMRFYGYHDLPTMTEEERARRLLTALGAGAAAVDCELDIFDQARQTNKPDYLSDKEKVYASRPGAKPTELSRAKAVIKRQREFVDQVKETGGEVVLSCHTQTVMRKEQGISIITAMENRGADLGKIVSMTLTVGDLVPFVESVISLRKKSRIPFNVMNIGTEPILGRLISLKLGSAWIYCRPNSGSVFGGQPTVNQANAFIKLTGLRI